MEKTNQVPWYYTVVTEEKYPDGESYYLILSNCSCNLSTAEKWLIQFKDEGYTDAFIVDDLFLEDKDVEVMDWELLETWR